MFANAQKRSRDATPIKILTYLLVQNTHDSKNKKKQKKQQLFFGLLGPQNVKISLNILDFFTRTILSPSGKKNWTLIKAKNGTHWLVKRVRIIKLKIYLTTETF